MFRVFAAEIQYRVAAGACMEGSTRGCRGCCRALAAPAAVPSARLQQAAGRPAQANASPHVEHAELLERWLMEGAYNKVLAARDDMPDPAYAYFMQRLLTTVRCGLRPPRRLGWTAAGVSAACRMLAGARQSAEQVLLRRRCHRLRPAAGRRLRAAASAHTAACQLRTRGSSCFLRLTTRRPRLLSRCAAPTQAASVCERSSASVLGGRAQELLFMRQHVEEGHLSVALCLRVCSCMCTASAVCDVETPCKPVRLGPAARLRVCCVHGVAQLL